MLMGKRFHLLLVIFIFSIFFNPLFIVISKADPLAINGSNQVFVGGSLTLSASGGVTPYTWIIVKGGGDLSSTTGDTNTYTAPYANTNCSQSPIICVVDAAGQKAYKRIAVTINVNNIIALVSNIGSCITDGWSCSMSCGESGCVTLGCGCACDCMSWDEHYCDGTVAHKTWENTYGGYFGCGLTGIRGTNPNYPEDCQNGTSCSPVLSACNVFLNPNIKAMGCCPQLPDGDTSVDPGTNDKGSSSGNTGSASDPNVCIDSAANLKSGNLYQSQDIAGFTFAYNSIDNYNGFLGLKWTHNYDLKLTALSGNVTLILKTDDSNGIYFRLSGSIYYPEAISGDTTRIIKNANGTYTRTAKNGTVQTFDSSGKLTTIQDKNANTTTLTYSGSNLTGITDKNGRTTTITSTNNLIIAITDAAGRTHGLAYTDGLLTSVTDPLGNVWQYTYDGTGKMLTKTDPAGRVISYTYDTNGKLLISTDPENKTRTMSYNQSGTSTFTEKDGGIWTYKYDPVFAVKTEKTDPLGNTTRYTYDLKRNLTSIIAPDGTTTRYTYDQNSNLTSVTDPLGNVTTYTYNSLNLVASMTDTRGKTTNYVYDTLGNLTSVTAPTGAVTQFQYDSKGNITAIINPLNKTTSMTYDQNNNLLTVTDPNNQTVTMTYDNVGNMLSQTDPLGNVTNFQYNSLNQLTQITDPLGKITQFMYDYQGNRLSATDANGKATQYTYDYKSKLTGITDVLNNVTALTYSGAGCSSCNTGVDKLTALTDAKNHTTVYKYDQAGNLIKETDPLGKITNYTYDGKGNLITLAKPDGKTITYSYDLAGRLTGKTYSDSSQISFQYDNTGNMTYAGNQNIAYNFVYDAVNRITGITDSNSREIQYQYDAAGKRTVMITPEAKTINYTYGDNNLLTQITADQKQYGFAYDAAGRRVTRTLPNGTITNYTYDQASSLTGIQTTKGASTLDSTGYVLDNVGNRLTKTTLGATYNYTYDSLNRLTQATPTGGNGQPETYTYDQVGNRLTKVPDTPPSVNETTIYSYDNENRLTSTQITRSNKTKEITFTYDPFGRRISKTIVKDEMGTECQSPKICPRTTNYVYDNQNIILEYDQNSNVITRYIHGPGIDEPLSMEKDNQVYYYHAEGLGSITALTDAEGNIIQSYDYDAFGSITSTVNITQPYTYTDREYDQETGMYFYRARYYDPKVGRFVTKDPIGFAGGDVNLYTYVRNNPVNYIDPAGLKWLRGESDKAAMGSDYAGSKMLRPNSPFFTFIERYVPNTYETSKIHDAMLDILGIQDPFSNPITRAVSEITMPIAFEAALFINIWQTITGTEETIFGKKSKKNSSDSCGK